MVSNGASTMGVDRRRRTRWRVIGGFRMTPTANRTLKTYWRNHDGDSILEFRKFVGDLHQGGRHRNRKIRTLDHHIIGKDPRCEDWIRRPNIVGIHLWSCHLSPSLPSLNRPEPTLIRRRRSLWLFPLQFVGTLCSAGPLADTRRVLAMTQLPLQLLDLGGQDLDGVLLDRNTEFSIGLPILQPLQLRH